MAALEAARGARALAVGHAERGRSGTGSRSTRTASGARAFELLSYPNIGHGRTSSRIWPQLGAIDPQDRRAARDRRQIRGLSRPPGRRRRGLSARRELRAAGRISTTPALPGLSNEVAPEARTRSGPRTIGQAGRIDGMTPAALTLLVAHVRRTRQGPSGRLTSAGASHGAQPANADADLAADRDRALALTPVSRETVDAARPLRRRCCCSGRPRPI